MSESGCVRPAQVFAWRISRRRRGATTASFEATQKPSSDSQKRKKERAWVCVRLKLRDEVDVAGGGKGEKRRDGRVVNHRRSAAEAEQHAGRRDADGASAARCRARRRTRRRRPPRRARWPRPEQQPAQEDKDDRDERGAVGEVEQGEHHVPHCKHTHTPRRDRTRLAREWISGQQRIRRAKVFFLEPSELPDIYLWCEKLGSTAVLRDLRT